MKILIVGAGKLGHQLAKSLNMTKNQVTLMDLKRSALNQVMADPSIVALQLNGVEVNNLKKAGVDHLDVTIAVTEDDETNLIIAFLAKKLGCRQTLARVRNPEYASQSPYFSEEMDIDLIVNPEKSIAQAIQHYLLKEKNFHMVEFAQGDIVLAEVHANAFVMPQKQKLKELSADGKVVPVAIAREGRVLIPDSEMFIEKTDLLYLAGKKESIQKLTLQYGINHHDHPVKQVVVIGGGRIGYYLTKSLADKGIRVTCIEIDRSRCKYLAQNCDKALIINADGTDLNLLKSEGVFSADALVPLTGHDEENLILSLLARQFGSKSVVTTVSRTSYIPILEKLGIDAAFDSTLLTASHVLHFILKEKLSSISLLLGGMAEVVEISVQPGAYITHKSLHQLKLPKGMVVGAILKAGEVIIPSGTTQVQPGDQVVVFLLSHLMDHLETIFYPAPQTGIKNGLWQ